MSKKVVMVDDDHGVRWSFDGWLKSAPGFSCAGTSPMEMRVLREY
jgi:hypothetical protein